MKALEKAEIDEEEVEEAEEVDEPAPDAKKLSNEDSDNDFGSPKMSPDADTNTASGGL